MSEKQSNEKLAGVCQSIIDNIPNLLKSWAHGKTNEKYISISSWYDYEKFALKSYFIDGDIAGARQHFYTCGCMDVYYVAYHDGSILEHGINHFSYALLSDSPALINRYARLAHSNFEKAIKSGVTATYIMQCLIKEDWEGYQRGMEIMKAKTLKRHATFRLDMQVFEAIAEKNTAKAESALAEFVTPKVHKQRNKLHTLVNEFISHPALGYAKLAWLKGLQVKVDSPLVPAALLPVQPLAEYKNEYAFLEGILY
jgi:hypothetical protein